jgi:hypothetical protein
MLIKRVWQHMLNRIAEMRRAGKPASSLTDRNVLAHSARPKCASAARTGSSD